MKLLEIKVNVTKDDLLQLRHDTHENVTMWFGYVATLWLLSAVPGNAAIVLMGLAALFFARLELGRHRGLAKSLALWSDVGESTYSFDDRGVRVNHSKGERQYDWPTLTAFRDHKSAILLYYLDLQSIFIPKRCLQKGEIEKLNEILAQTRSLSQEERRKRNQINRILFRILILLVSIFVCALLFLDNIVFWFAKFVE